HEEGAADELLQGYTAHLAYGCPKRRAPDVPPLFQGGKGIRRIVPELLEAFHLAAAGPVAEGLVLHHPDPHIAGSGACHRADCGVMMIGLEGNLSRLDLALGI